MTRPAQWTRNDFTIGQRGGDWYAFSNTPGARLAINERRIKLSFGADKRAAQRDCSDLGFTWAMEDDAHRLDTEKLFDAGRPIL